LRIFLVIILLALIVIFGLFYLRQNSTLKNYADFQLSRLTKPEVLDYSNRDLEILNTRVLNNSAATELNVSNNYLTGALPAEINKLRNLRVLNASNNRLTGIPAEIGQLTKLETVNFSRNNINSMPNEIANLKNTLKTLDLSNNNYSPEYQAKIKKMLPLTDIIF
jgi:Leucine-rich repeat (LRR) protein